MNKIELESCLTHIKKELEGYNNNFNSSGNNDYRELDYGYNCIGENEYQVVFGLHSKTKGIKKNIDTIIDSVGIQSKDVSFERIYLKKHQPRLLSNLNIGSSLSSKPRRIGTLGLFVTNSTSKNGFITCGHVLPLSNKFNSISVYSPVLSNKKVKQVSGIVGYIEQSFPPEKKKLNEIDAAFALINDKEVINFSNIINFGQYKGKELKVLPISKEIPPNSKVFKIGAKSLLKFGIYKGWYEIAKIGRYKFVNSIAIKETVEHLAVSSDSGGPAFIEIDDELFCIGIVFANIEKSIPNSRKTQSEVLICPIHVIMRKLNVKPF